MEKTRQSSIKITDKRVKSTTEAFQAIKTIKLYAWESIFQTAAAEARDEELRVVQRYQLIKALNTVVNNSLVPLISTVRVLLRTAKFVSCFLCVFVCIFCRTRVLITGCILLAKTKM